MAFFGKKKKEDDKKTKLADAKPLKVAQKKKKPTEKAAKASMKDLYSDGRVEPKTKSKAKGKSVRKYADAYRVLIKPLITEKAANLGTINKYVFAVADKANKIEIAKAVNEVYGVKPISVNIIRVSGKKVRYGRVFGKRKDWKKAMVTLPAGKTINIYEGV